MLHERERESAKIMSGAMYKIYNLIVDHDFKKDLKNDVQISIYALILTEIEKKKKNSSLKCKNSLTGAVDY